MMVRTNIETTMNLSVGVEMVAPSGYLSAAMWPLPRLGPALQRVGGAALCWAVLAGAEAWLRLRRRAAQTLLLAEAPISLLDSAICWWVFVSLAHTTRTLRLRR
ncbi:Transmembrane protein 87A [Papilio machaon]|uniref:Transmembrane protein 87A n=1 Tax=Papilio machaon TaxID=76193 RepID=A0A0N1IEN1_PAPMA|nr:Transmembrane protein 87A [Papilio machaon]